MKNLLTFGLLVSLVACGGEAGHSSGGTPANPQANTTDPNKAQDQPQQDPQKPAEMPYASLVADAASLPACDANAKDRLVYVKATEEFQTCDGTAWAAIKIKGDAGAPGAAGKDGQDAAANSIAAEWTCLMGDDDLDPAADITLKGMFAQVVKFSSGDFIITCQDSYANSTFTDSSSTSGTRFFPGRSVAATSGSLACNTFYTTATFDVDAGTVTYKKIGGSIESAVSCTKADL